MAVQGASHNAWLCHCHGDASLNDSNGVQGGVGGWVREKIGKRVKLKEATLTSRVSQANRQTYVTLNRPRLFLTIMKVV